MERFAFTTRKTINNKLRIGEEVLLALLLATGAILCMVDLFGLSYDLGSAFSGGIGSGIVALWNAAAEALGEARYIILPKLAGGGERCGLVVTLIYAGLWALAFFLLQTRKLWALLCIYLLPGAALTIGLGLTAGRLPVMILAAGLLFAALYMKNGHRDFGKNLAFLLIFCIALTCIQFLPGVSAAADKPKAVENFTAGVQETCENLFYGENPLGSGDLTRRQRGEADGTALEITMEKPQSMYLRGYTGDLYHSEGWEKLANTTYYAQRDTLYWLADAGFNPLGQSGQAAELTETVKEKREGTVEIEAKKADKRFAYIPYEITAADGKFYEEEFLGKGKSLGGSMLLPARGTRLGKYTYRAAGNSVKSWTDTAAKMFTEADAGGDEAIETYLRSESYYNEYVYDHFTHIDDGVKALLNDYIGPAGDQSKGHIDYKQAINGIKTYLDENFIYTENLGKQNTKADYGSSLEEFLETKKGYDVQFATAATLMFRYYGIPARYVEGYLLTPDDAEKMEAGESYALPLENAHAWTEIYIDGTGFVPMEVSPAYVGVMEEADMQVGISNNSLIRPFEENSQSRRDMNTLQEEKDDRIPSLLNILLVLVTTAILLLLLLLIFWAGKKLFCLCRERERYRKLFYQAEPKIAVSAIYGYMEDRGLPLKSEAIALGNRAAYSRQDVEEADRNKMLTFYAAAKKEKKEAERKRKHEKK